MNIDKKLGFGLMRLPLTDADDNTKIDYDTVKGMADKFISEGFTYFDTAAPYHKSTSEIVFRECVAKRYPRSAYLLADKLSIFMIEKAEDIPGFFASQLERCGVDYFDYYLLHAMSKERLDKCEAFGAFDFVSKMKAEGKIKHVGFSFHDTPEALEEILEKHPEMEFVQLQINYMDWEAPDVESRRCYEICKKHNKPVIVMEPVKGGLLVNMPKEAEMLLKDREPSMSTASWAIRYAASLDNVFMVLSGMSDMGQMEDNISFMKDFKPLTENEKELVARVAEIIKSKEHVACTACRYCVDGCPMNIPIPDIFKLVNKVSMFGEAQLASAKASYENTTKEKGKASDCIGCGQCEGQCPQHLTIIDYLREAAGMLEQ